LKQRCIQLTGKAGSTRRTYRQGGRIRRANNEISRFVFASPIDGAQIAAPITMVQFHGHKSIDKAHKRIRALRLL
jgi:hypothetical protein